jgi:Uma2 family endonuclease
MAKPLEYAQYLTYEDYAKIDDGNRYELIDGALYAMASPNADHQWIVTQLGRRLSNFLDGRRCEAFVAPFDVRLNADKKNKNDDTVVQPDVLVLCDKTKLGPKGENIKGAPDMVIEVISKSSAYIDRVLKHKKYMEAGVREYWIVDPSNKAVCVNLLENKKYYVRNYGNTDTIPVQVLSGLEINLGEIFPVEDE